MQWFIIHSTSSSFNTLEERKIGEKFILYIHNLSNFSTSSIFFFPAPTEIIIRVTVSIFRETVSRSRGQIRASRQGGGQKDWIYGNRIERGRRGRRKNKKRGGFCRHVVNVPLFTSIGQQPSFWIQEFSQDPWKILLLANSRIRSRLTFISTNRE